MSNYGRRREISRSGARKDRCLLLYAQGLYKPVSRILAQAGIGMALTSHHTLSSLFPKPKNVINFEQKHDLIYQFLADGNALCVYEAGRNANVIKREHVGVVKTFNAKKSALSQHVMDFYYKKDWDVKILKS